MNSRVKDITGKQYGYFTIIKFINSYKGNSRWLCKCKCGTSKIIEARRLKDGNIKSCGCLRVKNKNDNIGLTFNKWTIIDIGTKNNYYLCKCKCGVIKEISLNSIKRGRSKSCGCSRDKDLINKEFGNLIVVDKVSTGKWFCNCICGQNIVLSAPTLNKKKNCGCGIKTDLRGKIFGNLDVIKYSHKKFNRIYWLCKCKCGNTHRVSTSNLIAGNTKTCGCRIDNFNLKYILLLEIIQ